MRITFIKHLQEKSDQPWAKWLRRKERKVSRRWGRANVYQRGVKKKQIKELKETCVFESALRVWHEIGGTVIRGDGDEEMVVMIGKSQVGLDKTNNSMVYDELIRLRFDTCLLLPLTLSTLFCGLT
jgi:hypothetical protein